MHRDFHLGPQEGPQELEALKQKYLYRPKIESLALKFFLPIKNSITFTLQLRDLFHPFLP